MSALNVPESIMLMLKDYLHITYTLDESTQRRLENQATNGIAYIRRYCNAAATCEPGTDYAAMLCEYVLRAESGALETFGTDFDKDIREAKMLAEVNQYAEVMGYAEAKK